MGLLGDMKLSKPQWSFQTVVNQSSGPTVYVKTAYYPGGGSS
jgi:hypothetical protein